MRAASRLGLAAGAIVIGLAMALAPGVLSAQEGATVQVGGNDDLGDFLVGPDGMTLYIFTNDEPGVSNCTDDCATNWPPLTVEEGEEPTAGEGVEGTLDTIERDDGTMQVTLDGQPLYYWANDSQPGDATGQGVGDVWFVVEAAGAQQEATSTATPAEDGTPEATAEATETPEATGTPAADGTPGPASAGSAGLADGNGSALLAALALLIGAAVLVGGGRWAANRR